MATAKENVIEDNSLGERLRARIARDGPISFHDWMAAALYDPLGGYYCADRVRWGRQGDYRTAPEVSPLFAATFARYFAKLFAEMGSRRPWIIMEVGAGSGKFARGVMESLAARHSSTFAATRYLIDEINFASREGIAKQLSQFRERIDFRRIDQIAKPIEGVIFSNELLDAFPVHRVIQREGNWRELFVGLSEAGEFAWIENELKHECVANYVESLDRSFSEGQIIEVNLDAEDWLGRASAALERGLVISVDYGAEREDLFGAPDRRKGTLRAFHRHGFAGNILANPGEQDLTTTVDWSQITKAGERLGLRTTRLERLDQFLLHEGLLDELERLAQERPNEVDALRLSTTAREMIMPDGMAAAFQVLVQEKTIMRGPLDASSYGARIGQIVDASQVR